MSKKQIAQEKPKRSSAGRAFRRFKNVLSFIIFLGFAGFVFYTGWIQIRIPEGSYALAYTKFPGGYDSYLMTPEVFTWRWENLFPTNMTIHIIELDRQRAEYRQAATLPSGDLYGRYIREPEAFSYTVALDYSYSLKENSFTSLIEEGAYRASALEEIYSDFETDCAGLITRHMDEILESGSPDPESLEKDLISLISSMDSRIVLHDLRVRDLKIPDRELYERSRELYLAELDTLKELEFQAQQIEVKIDSSTERKMDLLKQYGAVFDEYPVLLQYFELDRDKLDPALLKDSEDLSQGPESE
ncbi:MAG: hypothetical protein PQJ50_07200 [Spirochaetales bacterium]|nr:hypothetical protein [Spirochaetales bacterium]